MWTGSDYGSSINNMAEEKRESVAGAVGGLVGWMDVDGLPDRLHIEPEVELWQHQLVKVQSTSHTSVWKYVRSFYVLYYMVYNIARPIILRLCAYTV